MKEMKLVPVNPTTEMKTAAINVYLFDCDTSDSYQLSWEEAITIYKAMINAYEEEK